MGKPHLPNENKHSSELYCSCANMAKHSVPQIWHPLLPGLDRAAPLDYSAIQQHPIERLGSPQIFTSCSLSLPCRHFYSLLWLFFLPLLQSIHRYLHTCQRVALRSSCSATWHHPSHSATHTPLLGVLWSFLHFIRWGHVAPSSFRHCRGQCPCHSSPAWFLGIAFAQTIFHRVVGITVKC